MCNTQDDPDETSLEELVGASGKLRVLDRLLLKLRAKGLGSSSCMSMASRCSIQG